MVRMKANSPTSNTYFHSKVYCRKVFRSISLLGMLNVRSEEV